MLLCRTTLTPANPWAAPRGRRSAISIGRSIVFFGLLLSPRAQDEAEGRQRTAAILTIVSDNVAPSVDTEGDGAKEAADVDPSEVALAQQETVGIETGNRTGLGIAVRAYDVAARIDATRFQKGGRITGEGNGREFALSEEIEMVVPAGIRVASHDLAARVDPPCDRQARPWEIKRREASLAEQEAVCHTGHDVVSDDIAATVDPLWERDRGAGEIERGEPVPGSQESVSRRPRLARGSVRAYDLMLGVIPRAAVRLAPGTSIEVNPPSGLRR